jgi:hypothetical protein
MLQKERNKKEKESKEFNNSFIISTAVPSHPIRNPSNTTQKLGSHCGDAVNATKANEIHISIFPDMFILALLETIPAKLLKNSPIEPRTATPNSNGSHTVPKPLVTHVLHVVLAPVPTNIT